MGYSGARLAPFFSAELSRVTARRLAERGSEHLLKRVRDNTPVDDSPFPSREPGTARASWRTKPVVGPMPLGEAEVYDGGVETEDKVARYLEEGTGEHGPYHRAYYIFPKRPGGWLHFFNRKTGEWVFAKSVKHPGIRPQYPLAIGAAIAEHEMEAVSQPVLQEWKRAVEARTRVERLGRVGR